jgi:hypothetical protein
MSPIRTGSGLWTQLVKKAALDLRRYDSAVEIDFRNSLSLPKEGSIVTHLRRLRASTDAVLGGFFGSIQPFTRMFEDILSLVEEIGQSKGKENLLIQFDFSEADKFKLDLDKFREQVERFRELVRPISIDRWTYDRLWSLWRAFGSYVSDPPNEQVKEWNEQYSNGRWPEVDLDPPQFADSVLNEYVSRAWQVRRAMIEAARQISPSPKGLGSIGSVPNELVLVNGHVETGEGVRGFLAWLHSDHWATSIASKAYKRAIEGQVDSNLSSDLTAQLRAVLDDPPPLHRDEQVLERDIEELLSLPIWQRRYELYSIWVLTQIIDALGGTGKFQFHLEGDVFHLPFAAKLLAVLPGVVPEVRVWSEVRYRLKSPRGKSRKAGMQPDYSLVVDTAEPPAEAFALIECKQYLRASARNFGAALIDYAAGQPKANVVLVNYGPAGTSVLNGIPAKLRSRMKIIGDLRPYEAQSEREFGEWIREQVARSSRVAAAPLATTPAAAAAEGTGAAPLAVEADIELRWNDVPKDLDLNVLIPMAEGEQAINFRHVGILDAWPWVMLEEDVRNGYGPEVVRVRAALPGLYRIAVHSFSRDGRLAGCGATVTFSIKGEAPQTFTCPLSGDGVWWYVCDVDFMKRQVREVNIISNEILGVAEY